MAGDGLGDLIKVLAELDDSQFRDQVQDLVGDTNKKLGEVGKVLIPSNYSFAAHFAEVRDRLKEAQTYSDNLMNTLNKLRTSKFAEREPSFLTKIPEPHTEKYYAALKAREQAAIAAEKELNRQNAINAALDQQAIKAERAARKPSPLGIRWGEEAPSLEGAMGGQAPQALRRFNVVGGESALTLKRIQAGAQEAHARFGVMANATVGLSTAMRLLGVESGLVVVETGRLVLYFGRAITSGGGVASMFNTIAAATKGFLVSIGPIGWAIAAVTAALAAAQAALGAYDEAQERAAKRAAERRTLAEEEAGRVRDIRKTIRDAEDQLAVARGTMSERFADELGLLRGGMPSDKAGELAYLRAEARAVRATKSIDERTNKLWLEAQVLEGHITKYDLIVNANERLAAMQLDRIKRVKDAELSYFAAIKADWDAEAARAQKRIDMWEKEREVILKMKQDLAVEFGGFNPSDWAKGEMRDLLLLREAATADRERQAKEARDTGFGVSALGPGGGAFRFGPAAMGSTFGVETEQKKTNEILKSIDEKIRKMGEEVQGGIIIDTMKGVGPPLRGGYES